MHPRRLPNVLVSAALALLFPLFVRTPFDNLRHTVFAFGDLHAFYCSARVALAGRDPYLAEPLGACERGLAGWAGDFVIPAPLPGHAIALFEPLAQLSFPLVAAIWSVLLALTFFALCGMTARLTRLPYVATLAAFLPLGLMIPIALGQLAPLPAALLVAAAVALCAERDACAALLAAAATIEPHIGLAACAALFVGRPRARPALIIAALVMAALCVGTVGLDGTIEYVRRVLPEHIAAEARFDDQYSLTYLLTWMRVPAGMAIAVGQWSYWLAAIAGVAAAIRLTHASNDPRYLIFAPMAVSVVVGPYTHVEHLIAALPLGMLLIATASGRTRVVATLGLVLVAWPAKFISEILGGPGAVVPLFIGRVPQGADLRPMLADEAWAARLVQSTGHLPFLLTKIPTWLGLALLVVVMVARLRSAPRSNAPSAAAPTEESVSHGIRAAAQRSGRIVEARFVELL
jgi:hypothetical protein